ncbi:unnamed protein product [Camellia sinensis]
MLPVKLFEAKQQLGHFEANHKFKGRVHKLVIHFSLVHRGCSNDPMSLLVYGGEAQGERYKAVSMPNQVTGKCSGYHRPLEPQISSQICPGTPNKATFF